MKPLILVTNDDGITAPGIRRLVEVSQQFGEVLVVAPDSPQSGKGHAITIDKPIRLHGVRIFEGVEAYECSGTPADCVKLAKVLYKDRRPAICVSGINHGSNVSINIIYSGTMSAAMEASLEGIPSIGFSLTDYSFEADFEAAGIVAARLIEQVLKGGMAQTKLLNVNIPAIPLVALKGMRVCRQGEARWVEKFTEATDPRGQKYYWLSGQFAEQEAAEDTDIWALDHGYVSIVPSMHDLTAHQAIAANQAFNSSALIASPLS